MNTGLRRMVRYRSTNSGYLSREHSYEYSRWMMGLISELNAAI